MELAFQQTEYWGKLLNFAPTKDDNVSLSKRQNNEV